jgi:hypothetical protein
MFVTGKTVKNKLDRSSNRCEFQSDKRCCCGGHNDSNAKSNKNHHSTLSRLLIRKSRLYKLSMRAYVLSPPKLEQSW